jgi:alcohol dehydrogenase
VARALGARNVVLADERAHVRAEAERLGMEAVPRKGLRRRPPAPLVVDMSFDSLGEALACTAADGVCSSAGTLHASAKVPVLNMYVRNATLHVGRTHARALIPGALELVASGRLQPLDVNTRIASFGEAPRVLAEHCRGGVVKTILTA